MLPREFETALQTILEQLTGLPEAWALTGSVGMVLQGMPLQVHDIDVQTSPLGAIQIQQRLEGWMVEPVRQVESSFMRSLLGRAVVEGVEVEIIGG
ncbi:nucleotidyltransferase domain-containing protein, partial [Bellilinea sp.]